MNIPSPQFIIDDLNELLNEKSSWTLNLESNKPFDEYLKYNECKTVDDIIAINPNYLDDIEDGAWNYRLDALEVGSYMFYMGCGLEHFNVGLPSLKDGRGMFSDGYGIGGGHVVFSDSASINIIETLINTNLYTGEAELNMYPTAATISKYGWNYSDGFGYVTNKVGGRWKIVWDKYGDF